MHGIVKRVKLLPHQETALELIRESIKKGLKRPMVAAPCAFGKTVLAAEIMSLLQEKGGHGVFICDRIKLVQQTIKAFDNSGVTFGVMQGIHERTDVTKTAQIASLQTLQSWSRKRKKFSAMYDVNEAEVMYSYSNFDVYIIDEAHVLSKYVKELMDNNPDKIFIGLSATPYSKGLGEYYNNLLVPATAAELIAAGYLTPIKYYGGARVQTRGIGRRKLQTGGYDFDPKDIAASAENDDCLNGNIVDNWLKHAKGMQTISFSPSIRHSKYLVEEFRKRGISAEHIDGYMDDDLRQELYEAHDNGEFYVLSCSQLLNTGYDAPQVQCLIDCYPTKSIIAYVQRAGRIMRNAEGKEFAVYLDHAGNFSHGPAEDITPHKLSTSEAKFNEKEQIKPEKSEGKEHECPECFQLFVGMRCECGYEFPFVDEIITDDTELVELDTPAQRNKRTNRHDKAIFYAELRGYAAKKKWKKGWADNSYREYFGVWPTAVDKTWGELDTTIMIGEFLQQKNKERRRNAAITGSPWGKYKGRRKGKVGGEVPRT